MGSLGSEFAVCTVADCCVGVTPGEREGEVVISFKSGAIQVYNVHDFRMVCSWQLPSSERLVCAAIVQPHSQLYWAVGTGQGLLEWSRGDKVLLPSRSSRPQVHPRPPVQLLSCAANTLLVYANGEVGVVGSKTCSLAPQKRKEWALHMAAVSLDRTVCVVGTARDVTVGIAESAEGKLGQPFVTGVQSRGAELVSSCISGDKLLLLFVKGELMVVLLTPPLHPVLIGATIPSVMASTRLLGLSSDYFALLTDQSLQLWDAQYYTCQQQVRTVMQSNAKVWCVECCVYVWSEDVLRGWRLDATPATLSAALGKQPSGKGLPVTLTSWPLTAEEMRDSSSAVHLVTGMEYLHALVNRTQTPDLQSFMSVFTTRELTPDLCYSDVIERLLCEELFWGCDALSALLGAGLVPSNVDVLAEAIYRQDWNLAQLCLTRGPTPPENTIINALQIFLSLPETVPRQSGGPMFRKDILCKLLCCPFTDVLMQSSLAVAQFPVVKELLLFLSEYVGVSALLTPTPKDSIIPYDVILEWIALILDVHFTQLALDQDSRQLLLSLQSKLIAQVTCYNRLLGLSSLQHNLNLHYQNCNH